MHCLDQFGVPFVEDLADKELTCHKDQLTACIDVKGMKMADKRRQKPGT